MKKIIVSLFFISVSTTSFANPDGEGLFMQQCAACHQATGEGITGAFPALKGNDYVQNENELLVDTIMYGRAGMPSFKDSLDDESFTQVVNYIKSAWGNQGKPIEMSIVTTSRNNKAGHEALARQN